MSIEVTLNGEPRELADATSVAGLIDRLGAPAGGRGVAVAVDGEVVPHGAWADTRIAPGARIEVVVAVQGG